MAEPSSAADNGFMNWLNSNASAIQAFASVTTLLVTGVLVWLTGRYVRLTKTIADSALDQVEHLKLTSRAAQQRAAQAVLALSKRIRVPLADLDARVPSHGELLEYALLSQGDISDLEALARQVNGDAVRYAGKAAVSLLKIIALIEEARGVNRTLGWKATGGQANDWKTAMDAAPKMLEKLEAACNAVAAA